METILIKNNYTEVIPVGSTSGRGVFVNYTASRGTLFEVGSIQIINKTSSASVNAESGGDEVGITFTASITTSNIYLLAIASDSAGRIEFKYTIKNI